jgi:hypothetical protein
MVTAILKAPNFMSSLEHDWRSPIWTHMYRFLARKNTLWLDLIKEAMVRQI